MKHIRINIMSLIINAIVLASLGLSSVAWADPGVVAKQNPMSQFIILGFFLLFLYFMIIRPQSKRAKAHQSLVDSLVVDDEVVTNGGIVGKITHISPAFVRVEIAQGVQVYCQKAMILQSLPKGTIKSL